ncbi:MAG: alkaline phosphatase PafA [Reichenbachiella sp.]|uniref:alkaline phosphatase PafA n=1 Tax=Reichenbachiella sp. TaxID=2184521 RepID=UPI0032665586
MRKISLLIMVAAWGATSVAQSQDKPKLVVGVVVDQMRYEYLHRFSNHYGDGGFKRLLKDGFVFKNAHFNYIPTYTGPGHASVYTGTTPRVHGIIANDWYDKYEKRERYCVEDNNQKGVGGKGKVGQRSPKNLKASTLTDELRLFTQNRAKVIGIAIKDRGAILPAGHNPTGAYWFDSESGNFVTSTFYKKSLPEWLTAFNKKKLAKAYMSQGWDTYKPTAEYVESARDDRPYEATDLGGLPSVFPYDFSKLDKSTNIYKLMRVTPYGSVITTDVALEAISGEELGQDDITDFLAISYSSPDYIGHAFGPYSKEIQDAYIRLDLELERLMKALDDRLGEGNWSMFLTADHAVADIPAYLQEQGQTTDYTLASERKKEMLDALKEKFGSDQLIENVSNHQVFLNKEEIGKKQLDIQEIKIFIINKLNTMEGFSSAFDAKTIAGYAGNDLDVKLLAAGLNSQMSGDIVYTLRAGWLSDWHKKNGGTTHGSGYSYDTHVPMIFYGWGINQGSTVTYHPITDIAPSVATLLNIKFPSGCTGQPAAELFE